MLELQVNDINQSKNMPKRILIVEDDRPVAQVLELKLSGAGYHTTSVFDGIEALAAIDKDQFSLIILDLILPKMDGFSVLAELQKKGSKIPVVALTNLSQPEDEQRVKELGAIAFFTKANTSLAEIVDHISKLFSAKKAI